MRALKLEEAATDNRHVVGGLRIDPVFHRFVESELLPAIGMDATRFWQGVEAIFSELSPVNQRLLETRVELQQKIDTWHKERRDTAWQQDDYEFFLREIGYLKARAESRFQSPRKMSTPKLQKSPVRNSSYRSAMHVSLSTLPMHAGAACLTHYMAQMSFRMTTAGSQAENTTRLAAPPSSTMQLTFSTAQFL